MAAELWMVGFDVHSRILLFEYLARVLLFGYLSLTPQCRMIFSVNAHPFGAVNIGTLSLGRSRHSRVMHSVRKSKASLQTLTSHSV
jgi:hypothetical protein